MRTPAPAPAPEAGRPTAQGFHQSLRSLIVRQNRQWLREAPLVHPTKHPTTNLTEMGAAPAWVRVITSKAARLPRPAASVCSSVLLILANQSRHRED